MFFLNYFIKVNGNKKNLKFFIDLRFQEINNCFQCKNISNGLYNENKDFVQEFFVLWKYLGF